MLSAPISLYIDLEEGQIADLEVVAKAAIAWSQGIKEIAYVIDPSIEVKIELASGTIGSLSLNSVITAIKTTAGKHPKLTTILTTACVWFALETASYTYHSILDYIFSEDSPAEIHSLSIEEKQELAREVEARVIERLASKQRKAVFQELERDPSIKGVGVTDRPGKKPSLIVPRSQFAERAGQDVKVIEEDVKRRTRPVRKTATLVSPVLKDAERTWRFQDGDEPEFGAVMKDHTFLEGLKVRDIEFPLGLGVEMVFDMEIKEELEGGIWVEKSRTIIEVISPKRRKLDLFSPNG